MRINLRGNAAAAALEQVVVGASFLIFYGLLIRQLGAAVVGVVSLVLVLGSVGALASGGLGSSVARFAPLYEGRGDRRSTVACIETILLCTGALYLAILAAAYFPLQALIVSQAGDGYADLVPALMAPAAVYVFLMGAASVTTLGLTALQRSDLRLRANVTGAVVCLAGVYWAVPIYGASAAIWALAAQAGVVLIMTWIQLRRILPELGAVPFRFRLSMARQLIGLGANLQVQTLLVAALEPTARLLIGHFGGLADVTYFSMASRFILQVRALVFAGAQPLLSAFSFLGESDPEALKALYAKAHLFIGYISLLGLSAAAAASPFVGETWIGERRAMFVISSVLLAAGWVVNTMVLAPYFIAYAKGRMTWNLVAHIVMLATSVILGLALATVWRAHGVVVGMAVGLLASGLIMGIGNAGLAPTPSPMRAHLVLGAATIAAAALAIAAYDVLRPLAPPVVSGLGAGALWLVTVLPAAWMHPARRQVLSALRP